MASRDVNNDTYGLLKDTLEPFTVFDGGGSFDGVESSASMPAVARDNSGYSRLPLTLPRTGGHQAIGDSHTLQSNGEITAVSYQSRQGLGIMDRGRPFKLHRVANDAAAKAPENQYLAASPDVFQDHNLISSTAPVSSYRAETNDNAAQEQNKFELEDFDQEYSRSPPNAATRQPFIRDSTTEDLKEAPRVRSRTRGDSSHTIACPSRKHIWMPRGHWLSVTLVLLSIFSTIFSGIYLCVAIRGPRYTIIHQDRSLSISTATLLIAFFAKLIELSFVTVFVAFIGQVISRRAFMKKHGRGITLAEMSMRNWIMQPGSMLTHMESVRFGLFSLLGVLAMCAAWVTLLYTSASAALVSPQLRFGGFEPLMMQGLVKASFANPGYVSSICQTPIADDPVEGADTCLQLEHAAQSYYNYYETYIRKWSAVAKSGNGTSQLKDRIPGTGLLYENITVTGAWLGDHDMAAQSRAAGRLVNNISMAMPHAGVFTAAMDPVNQLMIPEGNEGLGAFTLDASVPSPAIHVLCVNISREELRPIVYSSWLGASLPLNASDWPNQLARTSLWRNKTAVDDLFGWNAHGGGFVPPIFATFPEDYNTVLNDTMGAWGEHDAIYLLARGGPEVGEDYNLCSIRAGLTPQCSTRFNATSSGGTMEAICGDREDRLRYIVSQPDALEGSMTISLDYPNIAATWARALALSDGIVDGKTSNARLLTQMIPQETTLNPGLPSISEALAVMAGCTLLMGSQDTPFVQFWNYTETVLDPGEYQYFNASMRSQQYASGGAFPYQRGFFVVLFLVFAFNLLVLGWFLSHKGLVTDFSEPPNLFSLSINSPPSKCFAGSCGGGPDSDQYKVNWFVNVEGEHVFLENEEGEAKNNRKARHSAPPETTSPIVRMYSMLSKRKSML